MKLLVIGGGGREHAIAWRAAQSHSVTDILLAPGNAGTSLEPKMRNVAISADDIDGLLKLAMAEKVDLTIVGPEQPLVEGICDQFADAGLRCFGPSAKAAQLEGSKTFTKHFLQRHGIPTAAYATFTDANEASAYVRDQAFPLVVKADGLAAGKGVVIAETLDEALHAIDSMLNDRQFGDASGEIVIEEFLRGEEASFIILTDGQHVMPLATSQDHKARDEGDVGPNTGGMGAYSPAPVVTDSISAHVMRDVIQPTLDGLVADGIEYRGFLYAGLMIDEQGQAKVLEFNCRLGDPETQPLMLRLESDLAALCNAVIDGRLSEHIARWNPEPELGVVMAAAGYPGSYKKQIPLDGIAAVDAAVGVKTFHAGTATIDGAIVSSGGRVLCVTALGKTVSAAAEKAYVAADKISREGLFYRNDIGHRAIKREKAARS